MNGPNQLGEREEASSVVSTVIATDAGLATYVNGVQILASQWEFTLLFSQTSATPGAQQPGEELAVQVTRNLVGRFVMSPQHAKAFAEILRQNVQKYEEQHGEIPLMLAPEGPASAEEPAPGGEAAPPPEEAVRRVVEAARPKPDNDLPAEPPTTSPEESSHGD